MTLSTLEKRLQALGDPAIAVGLAVLTILSRLPFRTQYLFNWDAGNFALALNHYDVTQHQPHPPGYFFYVLVGRWLQVFTGEANAALVAESILFSGLAVAMVYLFGARLYNRPTGIVAAILLATSVTFISLGVVALSYVTLAFFSTAIAHFAYQTILTREDRLIPLALVYGLAGGFRAELVALLFPLFLAALFFRPRRAPLAIAIAVTAVALWLVPTVWLSGGVDAYLAVLRAYTTTDVIDRYAPPATGLSGLLFTWRDLFNYTGYALYAAALPVAGAAGWGLVRLVRRGRRALAAREIFLLLWPAPLIGFYAFVHIGDPGYVFSFVPALLLLGSRFLLVDLPGQMQRPDWRWLLPPLAIALINASLFLFRDEPLTAGGLRQHDARVAAMLDYLSKQDFETVMLLSFESYKSLRYYMPQYRHSLWVDLFKPVTQMASVPPEVTRLLLVDERLLPLFQPPGALRRIALPGATLGEADLPAGATLYYGPLEIRIAAP